MDETLRQLAVDASTVGSTNVPASLLLTRYVTMVSSKLTIVKRIYIYKVKYKIPQMSDRVSKKFVSYGAERYIPRISARRQRSAGSDCRQPPVHVLYYMVNHLIVAALQSNTHEYVTIKMTRLKARSVLSSPFHRVLSPTKATRITFSFSSQPQCQCADRSFGHSFSD